MVPSPILKGRILGQLQFLVGQQRIRGLHAIQLPQILDGCTVPAGNHIQRLTFLHSVIGVFIFFHFLCRGCSDWWFFSIPSVSFSFTIRPTCRESWAHFMSSTGALTVVSMPAAILSRLSLPCMSESMVKLRKRMRIEKNHQSDSHGKENEKKINTPIPSEERWDAGLWCPPEQYNHPRIAAIEWHEALWYVGWPTRNWSCPRNSPFNMGDGTIDVDRFCKKDHKMRQVKTGFKTGLILNIYGLSPHADDSWHGFRCSIGTGKSWTGSPFRSNPAWFWRGSPDRTVEKKNRQKKPPRNHR